MSSQHNERVTVQSPPTTNIHSASFGRGASAWGSGSSPFEPSLDRSRQQKVLRNTFALLALSMIPTIAGAWIGVQTKFSSLFAGSPFIGAIAFLAVAFGFFYLI